jgi:hypothetical protein
MVKTHRPPLFYLLIVIILLTSCQQEVEFGNENFDYIPTTPGSSWRYTSTRRYKYDLDATTRDTVINGIKYRVFNRLNFNTGVFTKDYYSKIGKIYRTYGTPAVTLIPGEIILLKDTVINSIWASQVPYSIFIDSHEFKIAERDIQYTVNNMQFDNVIKLDYVWREVDPFSGTSQELGTGKFYYARGVGLIESICNGRWGLTQIDDTVRLYKYDVK